MQSLGGENKLELSRECYCGNGVCVGGGRSEEGRAEGRGQSTKGSVGQDKQFILGGTGSPWRNLREKLII